MKIEKNIPIASPSRYDFVREMEVGDSVFYEDTADAKRSIAGMKLVRGLAGRQYMYRRQNSGGARIWRIE